MTSPLKCRICGTETVFIGSLGDIGISNFTSEPQESPKYPLELMYCPECTLLQLGRETPRDLLYDNYWYRSALNPVIVEDLKEIAKEVKGSVHFDIGSNDGTLLSNSPAKTKIAIDPSNIVPGNYLWANYYWEDARIPMYADTITAIACLYDLPDPNKFMANVKKHLAGDGIFIAQLQTLSPMIELNDVGNICHEHIEYYSYKSLVRLFEQNGLEIYKVEENSMNGGSYRIFAQHFKSGSIDFKEKEYTVKDLKDFFKRVSTNRKLFMQWAQGKNIVGYGASTKSATILQYYNYKLPLVVDVNPDKVGKYTTSGSLVVDKIPEDTEYLWVFPYGFLDYFKQKEKGYTGKWISTIPNFLIN